MKYSKLKGINLALIFSAIILILFFNNCARQQKLEFSNGSTSLSSFSGSCGEVLFKRYNVDVYPFFRASSRCLGCHIEGGAGLGLFASPNSEVSYAAFSAAGLSKISYMATNPLHKPPYTGEQNQPAINTIVSKWTTYESEYLDCVSKSENGGVNEALLTSKKGAPSIYSAINKDETLTWDLDLAQDLDETMTRPVPARITMNVRVLYQAIAGKTQAKGYIFSNPTLSVKDSSQQIIIEGIFFQINGQPISSQTTFTSVSRVVGGTVPIPLMNANANTLIEPISTTDVFQLYIRRIVATSGTEDSPAPLTPILKVTDSDTNSDTLIKARIAAVSILRDASVVRWCLSEQPTRPESTEAPCVNSSTGANFVNGWSLTRPNNFTFSNGDGAKTLYLWVADQNLKINNVAASASVTLDMTAPAAPTINSITLIDTPVANMSVSHANESDVTGWCVFEQSATKSAPNAIALNNPCWKWADNNAKPATVGFKEGGSRNVWVYVRDKAGNVSLASNKQTVSNGFGAISFAELTAVGGGAQAIFRNRCYTCHGTNSNPGFNKLQLFDYAKALLVVDSGVLISRINNPISPMPNVNNGLMPQRERDLIRLWTMPEEGDQPLP